MRYTQRELAQRYKDVLDEVYGDVKIGPYEYPTSKALEAVDPIAFNVGQADWTDSELGESIWEKDGEYYDDKECTE